MARGNVALSTCSLRTSENWNGVRHRGQLGRINDCRHLCAEQSESDDDDGRADDMYKGEMRTSDRIHDHSQWHGAPY